MLWLLLILIQYLSHLRNHTCCCESPRLCKRQKCQERDRCIFSQSEMLSVCNSGHSGYKHGVGGLIGGWGFVEIAWGWTKIAYSTFRTCCALIVQKKGKLALILLLICHKSEQLHSFTFYWMQPGLRRQKVTQRNEMVGWQIPRTNPYICFQTSACSHDLTHSQTDRYSLRCLPLMLKMSWLYQEVTEKYTEVKSENDKH